MTQTSLAAALTQAGVVSSNFVYFDLMEDLGESLSQGELKARTLSSMAWMLDMTIINTARSVFYDLYKERVEVLGTSTAESFNEFIEDMRGMGTAGTRSQGQGFGDFSTYKSVAQMLTLHYDWHSEAQKAATRAYRSKSLDELLLEEKMQEVGALDRQKFAAIAEWAADGDPEIAKVTLERMTETQALRFKESHEVRRRIAPAVSSVIHLAATYGHAQPGDTSQVAFHALPEALQKRLITSAIKAIERALVDMGTMRSVTMHDFALYLKEARMATARLNDVLKAPKFRDL